MACSSQLSLHSAGHAHHPNRLLWRGSIVNQAGLKLHGLAIVAHAMHLNKTPKASEDPFSADVSSPTLSDTCLEIEMLRGRELHVSRFAKLTIESEDHQEAEETDQWLKSGSRKSRVASLLKGKGTESNDQTREIPFSELECEPDVRLYLDPRCGQTQNWIFSQLCKKDLTSGGFTSDALVVTLDQAIDDSTPRELIIFGRRADAPDHSQPSTSTGVVPLELVIGQRKLSVCPRIPRPDDPMPRVSTALFADTLRRSGAKKLASSGASRTKVDTRPTADQPASLTTTGTLSAKHLTRTISKPGSVALTAKTAGKRNPKALKKAANTPGRRVDKPVSTADCGPDQDIRQGSQGTISQQRGEKRRQETQASSSTKKMKTGSKTPDGGYQLPDVFPSIGEEDEDDELGNDKHCFPVDRSPSPSPASFRSKHTSHLPTPETLGSPSESTKPLDIRRGRFGDADSNDLPSKARGPQKSMPRPGAGARDKPGSDQRPSSKTAPASLLEQNKLLIRKLANESLNNRGIDKGDGRFKDLYSAVCKGVQFAMREALEKRAIDKTLTRTFVEGHLAMYMVLGNDHQDSS